MHTSSNKGTATKNTATTTATPTATATATAAVSATHLLKFAVRLQRQGAVLDREAVPPDHDVGGRAAPKERRQALPLRVVVAVRPGELAGLVAVHADVAQDVLEGSDGRRVLHRRSFEANVCIRRTKTPR